MHSLKKPAHLPADTFRKCISRVRNPSLKSRLTSAEPSVVSMSAAFDDAMQKEQLHAVLNSINAIPSTVTAGEMQKVYTNRMAKDGAPGRNIYNDILMPGNQVIRCPYCAKRTAGTLDHFLPKSGFPALVVTPLNLTPACSDCNKNKLGNVPSTQDNVGLHPYYDNLGTHIWLQAKVDEPRSSSLTFSVIPDSAWSQTLTNRVKRHFKMLKLGDLYEAELAHDLKDNRGAFSELYATGGLHAVRQQLDLLAKSAQSNNNVWKTAGYRAWEQSNWFCNGGYLK